MFDFNNIWNGIVTLILAAFTTVGLMEFIKGFFKNKEINSNVWRAVLPAVACGVAALYLYVRIAFWGVLLVAVCQLSYDDLLKIGRTIVETAIKNKLEGGGK
jgi:hypothetical protein